VKVLNYPRTCVGCGLVLLNVFLAAATAIGQLAVNPSTVNFGSIQIGTSVSQSVLLNNTGSANLTISQATVSGTGFSVSGPNMPLTLAPGQGVNLTATFGAQSPGRKSGSLFVGYSKPHGHSRSTNAATVSLSGTGISPGQLTANPTSLNFANVQVGSSQTQSATLTNSGGSSLTVAQDTLSGSSFTLSGLTFPLTLGAGQGVTFSVVFAPQSASTFSGNAAFTSDGSNPTLNLPLSGTGVTQGTLTSNPTSLAFGNVQVGNNTSLSETLTSTGGSSVTISQVSSIAAAFSISGLTLPMTLTPNQSVTFAATFAPISAGAASENLSVVSNASNSPLTIALSGTGTSAGQLAVSPTSLSFGNVAVGSSSALNGTLTASGASVTVSSTSLNNNEFALSGISLPATLTAGHSATFTVTFTPSASGATSASLSFSSNASNSPAVQTMTGTGSAPTQHTVDLTWSALSSAVGYNVYRGSVSGGPYTMINSALDSTTAYTDSTVLSGQTYYYVATAVDAKSNESGYSNQATAVIPNP
jgi:hypothetical protein